jgi:hypothetical protein
LIGLAVICFVAAAAADDGEVCVRGSGDAAMDACTRAIDSSRFDKHNIAIIYSNRAINGTARASSTNPLQITTKQFE